MGRQMVLHKKNNLLFVFVTPFSSLATLAKSKNKIKENKFDKGVSHDA
jgi:hypothetical protein